MFMEKLNQLINSNHIPFFENPSIICERPQFQLLYEDLGSIVQTLFIDQHQDLHDLHKLNDLKKRFIHAAEEAQFIVDLFLSCVHIRRNNGSCPTFEDFYSSLKLDDVRKSLNFVKVEFMRMRVDNLKILDSSRRTEKTLNQSVAAAAQRNSLGLKKLSDDVVVGINRDSELIRDKLVDDQKKLDVVSIVGMGGIGKTTLATKVFNDGYVKHHFHVRVWVTVSQTYDKRDVLLQILSSICDQLNLEKASDSRLREMVHKHLMGKRYLIVIDDIWHIETWDNLKLFFPHDNTGSRILLTSRLTEVAKHANSYGLIHQLGCLNKEQSWELLCQKVFHGNACPEWSIEPGMRIVEICQGLPLALVVIAGVLEKEAWSKKLWVEIACRASSYLVGGQNGCLEILGLSYNHLPHHLRECFLYLGGFPEDHKFQVQRLIWLWVAEGFIEKAGNRSLEDIAEGYLMDLIDRNLIIVSDKRKSNGAVKACILHDLVRELCQRKAMEERFFIQRERQIWYSPFCNVITSPYTVVHMFDRFCNVITSPYAPVHMFINKDFNVQGFPYPSTQNLRSILFFSYLRSLSDGIATHLCSSFVLLRVLDLQSCSLNCFPKGMELLVHLRYLAIWNLSAEFPSSICNLWSLQTLIYISEDDGVLPSNISDLVNLRHLLIVGTIFSLPFIEKPMNLQTISGVVLDDGVNYLQKCFPYIKELTCTAYLDEENDFKSLTHLEKLKFTGVPRRMKSIVHDSHIAFPATLKTLALSNCRLPWSDMSIIQSLSNLQVLKLHNNAFEGSCWNTDEQEFRQLKVLRLGVLDIELWEAYSASFPCLKQLEIFECMNLEEIPVEIGDIPTLELIKIYNCSHSVGESVRRIEEGQHNWGYYDLKIDISEDMCF